MQKNILQIILQRYLGFLSDDNWNYENEFNIESNGWLKIRSKNGFPFLAIS
jgi:hypothetical protein